VVPPGAVQAHEGDRVHPRGDREAARRQPRVAGARRGEGPHAVAVDRHAEVLLAAAAAAPRRQEGELVAAGGQRHRLAERTGSREEGDLGPGGGGGGGGGEAAAVGADAGVAGVGPGRAGRVVLEAAGGQRRRLEAAVGQTGRGCRARDRYLDVVDEGGVVAPG